MNNYPDRHYDRHFHRVQPKELRNIPFTEEHRSASRWDIAIGIVVAVGTIIVVLFGK